jgi:virulence factor Mce-like protein
MTLDPDVHVPAGAAALVVTPSIVADRYVQLTPVWTSGPEIEDGAEIALNKTAVPVELDQLFRSLNDLTTALGPNGANANGAFGALIQAGATNLDGNGEKLNQMLRDLGKATRTLNGSQDDLFTTLESVQRFTTMLAQNDASVGKFNALMVDVTQFLASERDDFGASLHELTDALSQVQDFVKNNRGRLKSNVDKLSGITQVLVNQKNSLDEALSAAPLALGNLVNAYDAGSGTLDGRGNLNEYSFGAPNLPLPSAGGAG